jgi:hypothetical protein
LQIGIVEGLAAGTIDVLLCGLCEDAARLLAVSPAKSF